MARWLIAAGGDGTNADRDAGGTWATAFPTLEAATLDAAVAAGDQFFIRAGDNVGSYTAAITLTSPGSIDVPCELFVVDGTTFDAVSNDTVDHVTTTVDLVFNGTMICHGLRCYAGDDLDGGVWSFYNGCRLATGRASGVILTLGGGNVENWQNEFIGGEILGGSAYDISIPSYGQARVRGVSFTPQAGASFARFSGGRGNVLDAEGLDLSGYTADLITGTPIISTLKMVGCRVPANYTLPVITSRSTKFDLIHCDAGNGWHHQHRVRRQGEMITDTSLARTATYNAAGDKFSLLMTTTAYARERTVPMTALLAEIHDVDLTAGKTVTVQFAQLGAAAAPAALTDQQFEIFVERPDAAAHALRVWQGSSDGVLPTDAGTDLPASAETWVDATDTPVTANITRQQASVTIPAVAGAAAVPIRVWAYLYAPGLADGVNVCPDVVVA